MNEVRSAKPLRSSYTLRGVTFEVERQPEGKKYPSYVKEHYELTSAGQLKYTAYFGGMPIEMNHMDSVEWKAGEHGQKVLDSITALLLETSSGIKELADDRPTPTGVYLLQLTRDHADSTRYVDDKQSRAWAVIDGAFRALLVHFEQATGRPKKPSQLPQ